MSLKLVYGATISGGEWDWL